MTITRSSSLVVGGILALSAMFGSTTADSGCKTINSIQYCKEVESLGYSNIGYSGQYKEVTGMDKDSCTCTYAPTKFSGSGAPLSEPLSVHFRGPLSLKQFAFYTADNKKSKRSEEHLRRHAHGHKHRRAAEANYEIVTEHTTVYSTVEVEATDAPVPDDVKNYNYDPSPPASSPTPVAKSKSGTAPKPKPSGADLSSAGTFKRQAYYNSQQGVSEGLVFLNHRGGQGSGDFDMGCLGQSISYASKDNTAGSSQPETMGDVTLSSDQEFMIYSDKKCDSSCGYYRPGIPAYHGFDGDIRVFAFEFTMPRDKGDASGKGGFDVPALWLLNAKIARTAQYGIKSGPCSCWTTGCGEADIFEALPGDPASGQSAVDMMKSHIHCSQGGDFGGGGNTYYMSRPVDKTMKLAAMFVGENLFITKLPDNTNFDETLSDDLFGDAKKTQYMFKLPN